MPGFDNFFLMSTEDVRRYAVEVLHRFAPDEPTECTEIGDGNINYVFRVVSKADGHSVIVKQADRLLRSSGRPLDMYRNKIEAAILRLEGELAPGMVPEVYHYDEVMAATSMEDVSDYKNLRRELAANRVYPHLAESISSFMADTLLPTTDLVLDAEEKKRRVKFFTNPELCKITEDLVLTEPYYDYKGRNILFPGNERFVQRFLYEDEALHAEVALLRLNFMNNAQALLHGDLHSGSIFINEKGLKVLDPEFAFYGPMGYDIGNVIGNLFFAWASKAFTMPDAEDAIAAIGRHLGSDAREAGTQIRRLRHASALPGARLQGAVPRRHHGRFRRVRGHGDHPPHGGRLQGAGGHVRHRSRKAHSDGARAHKARHRAHQKPQYIPQGA